MAKRQYHNLAGLVRDLATARGEGAELWHQFVDELEYALEEVDAAAVEDGGMDAIDEDVDGVGDESSDHLESDVGDDGPHAGGRQLGLGEPRHGGQSKLGLGAPLGAPAQARGGASVPDAAPLGGAGESGCARVNTEVVTRKVGA